MDLLLTFGFLFISLLSVDSELPNPELCINKNLCGYGEEQKLPLHVNIYCSADYKDIRKMFSCLRSSKEHILDEVSLEFVTPTVLQKDFFDGHDIVSLELRQANISNLNFSRIKNLATLKLTDEELTEIPLPIKPLKNLTRLWIKNQTLEMIPDFAFQEMTSLEQLDLSFNSISKTGQYAFKGLHNLEWLDLQFNNLTNLPSVGSLSKLYELELSNNKLAELTSNAFLNLTSLNRLLLHHNQIYSIHENAFAGLFALYYLDLHSNNLVSVPTFKNLSNLLHLDLSENKISECKSNSFLGLTSLDWLVLNENSLSSLDKDCFVELNNLTELTLSANNFTSVPSDALRNLSTLTSIYLGNNEITEIKKNDFIDLNSLEFLNLTFNKISKIDSAGFEGLEENLKYLHLGENHLTKIPVQALKNMRTLLYVSFGSFIEFIEPDAFKQFGKNIVAINLSGNRIKSFADSAFNHLPSLRDLYLNSNQLHHLDFAVFQPIINGLRLFPIRGNPLACSCDLYWYYKLNSQISLPTDFKTLFPDLENEKGNNTQGQSKHNGTVIHLETECRNEWKPKICNASSLYKCMSGDFCNDVVGC